MTTKIQIHIYVQNKTWQEAEAIRVKIEQFLANEPDAKLLTFQFIEEGDGS